MPDSPTPREPREPQQPLRAVRTPSDWSPRPIPQPAPERRTADPVTPTLKELAARERQRAAVTVEPTTPSAAPATGSGARVHGPSPDDRPDTGDAVGGDVRDGVDADALALDPADVDPCAAAAVGVAPKQLQANAAHTIPRLMAQARAAGLTDDQTAYVLGTAEHESGLGALMIEQFPRDYESRKDLGNVRRGDGRRFIGRGFVQITGRANYAYWGKRLKLDLVGHPELATDPDVAAAIAVRGMRAGTFTGKRLDDYVNADSVDYRNARRVVNGTDEAERIARYAERYRTALSACRRSAGAAPPSRQVGPQQ